MYEMCKQSNIQKYKCQVCARPPWNKDVFICFDSCLATEIKYLWSQGIRTTGCCCGRHVDSPPDTEYIGVMFGDIPKMKAMGYKIQHNSCRPNDEDSFIPKTNLIK